MRKGYDGGDWIRIKDEIAKRGYGGGGMEEGGC